MVSESLKRAQKKYKESHKEQYIAIVQKWQKTHREQYNEYKRKYYHFKKTFLELAAIEI